MITTLKLYLLKQKERFTEVKYNDKRSTYKQMQDIINNSQELAKEEIATELNNNTKNTKRKKRSSN